MYLKLNFVKLFQALNDTLIFLLLMLIVMVNLTLLLPMNLAISFFLKLPLKNAWERML